MAPDPRRTPVPDGWLAGCAAAHRRLEAVAGRLTDDAARRASLLDGWSVGHVLTHLARNADSHTAMVEAAGRNEVVAQYPGGAAQREGDIAEGQGRRAAELAADVERANERLERAWAGASEEAWATGLGLRSAGPATLAELVFLRWREVEVHLVDLGLPDLGCPDWDGLDAAYLDLEWSAVLAGLGGRVPEGATLLLVPGDRPSRAFGRGEERAVVRAAPGRILGWLLGRGGEPAWPALRPWS